MSTDLPPGAARQSQETLASRADAHLSTLADATSGAYKAFHTELYTAARSLPPPDVVKPHSRFGDDLNGRIVQAIAHNEGSLTNINMNDNGHGISIGIRQWNQERGEMPALLKAMHDHNPQKFDRLFGPFAWGMRNEHWVRTTDFVSNPDIMRRMKSALRDPEFQQVQIDKAREFAQKSVDTARRYGMNTERGAALVGDIINQMGEGGARRILALAHLKPGRVIGDEKSTLHRIERLTYRPNSRGRFNSIVDNFKESAV